MNTSIPCTSVIDAQHQPERQRFIAIVDGHEAVADYRVSGVVVDFNHTYVPEALRGQGVAEQLVAAALAWARSKHYKIEASCGYVQRFLDT